MSKIGYGLNLRLPAQQKKQQPAKPPRPPPFGFNDDDDDDVEKEISRQASKNKSLKDIEQQQKKALEEDPTVFDYDGVYDEMKEKVVQPRARDREERKSKYIGLLKEKAKEREQYREIVFERKIAKERSQDDHLYADKDKFVTRAYRKKLEEQEKWKAEERLRELREAKEDVTKKKDLSDFYFNLGKNVAFGANEGELRKPENQVEPRKAEGRAEPRELEKLEEKGSTDDTSDRGPKPANLSPPLEASAVEEKHGGETSTLPKRSFVSPEPEPVTNPSVQVKTSVEQEKTSDEQAKASGDQPSSQQPRPEHHKRSGDAVAAAKERYLARKKAKELY